MLDDPEPDFLMMAARAELIRRGEPHHWWCDYIRQTGLDVPTVSRFAGLIAVTACVFYDHGRFDFVAPKDREAEPAAVIEALGADAATCIDLVAWPLHAPERFATLFGEALLLGIDRVGNAASYFSGQPLQLYKTPLAWLQASCRGAVIIEPHGASQVLCHALGRIAGEDIPHAIAIQNLTHLPPRQVLVPRRAA